MLLNAELHRGRGNSWLWSLQNFYICSRGSLHASLAKRCISEQIVTFFFLVLRIWEGMDNIKRESHKLVIQYRVPAMAPKKYARSVLIFLPLLHLNKKHLQHIPSARPLCNEKLRLFSKTHFLACQSSSTMIMKIGDFLNPQAPWPYDCLSAGGGAWRDLKNGLFWDEGTLLITKLRSHYSYLKGSPKSCFRVPFHWIIMTCLTKL